MSATEIPLTIELATLDTVSLLKEWRWIVPFHLEPIQMTTFGDWFFSDPIGRVFFLDLIEGNLVKVAGSIAEFNLLKNTEEKRSEWFLEGFVFRCYGEGMRLSPHKCYGWRLHPMIGGQFTFENIKIFSIGIYQTLMAQLLPQWKASGGKPAQIKIVKE